MPKRFHVAHEVSLNYPRKCCMCSEEATFATYKHGEYTHYCTPHAYYQNGALKSLAWYNIVLDNQEPEGVRARRGFEKAKASLIRHHPFYGSMLLSLEVAWTDQVPIAATDGKRLYLNEVACADLNMGQWKYLLIHEVQHVVHLHPFRKKGRDNHMGWNMACDYVVNALIEQEGGDVQRPSEGLLIDLDRFADTSPEYVYRVLREEGAFDQPDPQPGQGGGDNGQATVTVSSTNTGSDPNGGNGGGQGPTSNTPSPDPASCSGGSDDKQASGDGGDSEDQADGCGNNAGKGIRHVKCDWLHGDVMEPADLDEMERESLISKIKSLTTQAAYNARALGADTRIANAVIEAQIPKRSWQISLQSFVSTALDKDDYSYRRPNKRYFQQGLYMPSLQGSKPPKLLAVAIDVSSSISQDQLKLFWPELSGLIATHPNMRFKIYFCNTAITDEKEVGIEDLPFDFAVHGYGGTRFDPPFNRIEEEQLPVSGLIYFTDMESHDYPSDPEYPVLWLNFGRPLTTGNNDRWVSAYTPPFGEIVDMA